MARLLVVDDEEKIRRQIATALGRGGHSVDQAEDVEQALVMAEACMYNLVITDVCLPGRSGVELVREVRRLQPLAQVVVITAFGSVADAVEVIKLGAFDYLQKPFTLEALGLVVERALSVASLRAEHQYLMDETRSARGGQELVGSSPAMAEVKRLLAVAATQPSTVLLHGESGTGKEIVAEALHRGSGKGSRPLVKVNCPAIPKDLFESELFGHIRGAFTGAVESRRGKFELAHGGSLFLDEVSEIPLDLQSKLLRVLEERRFTRVGGTHEIAVDLRIIAATNRSLEQAVTEGRFRKDLYFRLNIFPIPIPPLRARRADIPALARHLVSRIATQYHMSGAGLDEEALEHLMGYAWPGNVRELRNVLERGLLLAGGGVVGVEHLPTELASVPCGMGQACACEGSLGQQTEAFQRGVILAALQQHRWRKKDAAQELGLSPRALSHYIGKFDLDRER